MKWKCFIALFVMAGFNTLNAADKELLQTFMENVLHRPSTENRRPPVEDSDDDHGIPPTAVKWPTFCPRQVNIAWQLKPPYTLPTDATDGQPNVDGIFHQVLDSALDKCCAFYEERKPILKYLTVASNTSALLQNIFHEDVSLVFPVRKDQHDMYHSQDYINVIESLGVVLLQRKPWYSVKRGADLFKALLGTWPIVVFRDLVSKFGIDSQ